MMDAQNCQNTWNDGFNRLETDMTLKTTTAANKWGNKKEKALLMWTYQTTLHLMFFFHCISLKHFAPPSKKQVCNIFFLKEYQIS